MCLLSFSIVILAMSSSVATSKYRHPPTADQVIGASNCELDGQCTGEHGHMLNEMYFRERIPSMKYGTGENTHDNSYSGKSNNPDESYSCKGNKPDESYSGNDNEPSNSYGGKGNHPAESFDSEKIMPNVRYYSEQNIQDTQDGGNMPVNSERNLPDATSIEDATKMPLTLDVEQSPIKVALKSKKMGANLFLTDDNNTTRILLQICHNAGGDRKESVIKEQHGLVYKECSDRLIKTDQELITLNMYHKEKAESGHIDHIWMGIEWDEQNIWVGPLHLLPLSSRKDLAAMGILHCKLHNRKKLKYLELGALPEGADSMDFITVSTILPQPPPGSKESQYKFIPWE